ncbi:hypothetical protein GQ53DRAFT_448920 [Thozetella sp. PMI_491]|nr:hypothetical protein GQ53DRAFT_448920 [Thozetella sp. PMI_491]
MMARLRTSNGCLACRERRKKCDEAKPICRACTQRDVACVWPSKLLVDRRRRRVAHSRASPSRHTDHERGPPMPYLGSSPLHITATVVEGSPPEALGVDPTFLFQYCIKFFLPAQFHQPNFIPVTNIAYLISMCLNCQFVRDAVVACAMTTVATDRDAWQAAARERYLAAVRGTSVAIGEGGPEGKNSEQLMTAMTWLCVFENSQLEAGLHCGVHLRALAKCLARHTALDQRTASPAALDWERQCFESFIYHSVVTMLFDGDLDLTNEVQQVVARIHPCLCQDQGPLSLETIERGVFCSPDLGVPCEIFLILMRAIRTIRAARPPSVSEEIAIWSDYFRVRDWQAKLDLACTRSADFDIWMGKPYVIAARIVLLQAVLLANPAATQMDIFQRECEGVSADTTALLATLQDYLHRTWGKFLLLPLAVIGASTTRQEGIEAVRTILQQIVKRSGSTTVSLIVQALERVWKRHEGYTNQQLAAKLCSLGLRQIMDVNYIAGAGGGLSWKD